MERPPRPDKYARLDSQELQDESGYAFRQTAKALGWNPDPWLEIFAEAAVDGLDDSERWFRLNVLAALGAIADQRR